MLATGWLMIWSFSRAWAAACSWPKPPSLCPVVPRTGRSHAEAVLPAASVSRRIAANWLRCACKPGGRSPSRGLLRSVAFGSRIPRFFRHLTRCLPGKRANGCESPPYRLNEPPDEVHILTRHRRAGFERLCPCLRRPDLSVRGRSE